MKNQTNPKAKRKRGFGLILVLGFAAVLAVFTAAIGAQASYNLNAVSRRGQTDQAYYGAYTGIQMTVALLREPPQGVDFDSDGVVGDSWLEKDRKVRLLMPNGVEAAARLYHNLDGFAGGVNEPPVDRDGDGLNDNIPPDGTTVPPEHFYIMAVGETSSGVKAEAVTMGSTLTPDFPVLTHAAIGLSRVAIDGRVDHFDSLSTPFVTVPAAGSPHAATDAPLAHVASNNPDTTQVVIGPNAEINGYLLMEEGSNSATFAGAASLPVGSALPATFLSSAAIGGGGGGGGGGGAASASPPASGNSRLNGYVDVQSPNKRVVDIERPDTYSPMGGGSGVYTIPSGLTLTEGTTYYLDGSLHANSSSSLTVADTDGDGEVDPVRILVDDTSASGTHQIVFNAANNINQGQPPRNLKIFAMKPNMSFQMTGSEAYALVAGAGLNVTIDGNSELWGAVLGNDVALSSGSAIHFDSRLLDANLVAANFGFTAQGAASSTGSVIPVDNLAPIPGTGGEGGGTTGAAPGGTTGAPPATTGGTTGGGCGCGCGGGSMMMAMK